MKNRLIGKKQAFLVLHGMVIAVLPLQVLPAEKRAALEEVIVTAQKQEENIQRVPLAITATTAEEIEKKGITSYEGIARDTPSIQLQPFPSTSSTLILYMRGMGDPNPVEVNSEGAVGLYVDGFVISRANASTFDLADVERVEVLRGPQGTLYGKNTTGGAVNIISKQPTGEFGFKQKMSFGTRNYFRSLTAIDLPSIGGVASKVSVIKSSIDGYVKNRGSSHDYGEQSQLAGRLMLHWEVSPSFSVDYFLDAGSIDETPIYFQNPSLNGLTIFDANTPYYAKSGSAPSKTYRAIDLPSSGSEFEGHGLTLTWDATDYLTLKSLTGYREIDSDYYQDWAESFGLVLAGGRTMSAHQFSQELQFIGSFLRDQFRYVAGLYYFEESGRAFSSDSMDIENRFNAEGNSKAVYGQITWAPPFLDQNLELTLGGRYTKDERSGERFFSIGDLVLETGDQGGYSADLDFDRFTPSFSVSYQWTDEINTYFKYATGYRAGGIYSAVLPGAFNQSAVFDPEKLNTYEVGLKSYWFNRTLRLNVAAFDSEFEDMQLLQSTSAVNPGFAQMVNAGDATIRGVEVELTVVPVEDLTLNLNYAYLDTEIDRVDVRPLSLYDNAANPASPYQVGDNIAGLFAIPAAENSYSVSLDYIFLRAASVDFGINLDYRWQDDRPRFGKDVPNHQLGVQKSWGVLNARLSADIDLPRGDRVNIGLWGKNITNEKYEEFVIAMPSLQVPATPGGVAGPVMTTTAWSAPPSYGIDINYTY